MTAASGRPLVSVIIPFYDTPTRFLREAVESVLAQRYTEWELFLVDDGSSAESAEVARAWVTRHGDRMRYLEHPGHENRGHSASRMLGVESAAGDYVAFLDSDDVWLPHKLEQQVALMSAHPQAAMSYGKTRYWFSWTARPEDRRRDFVPHLGVRPGRVVEPPALLPMFLRGQAAVPCICSILVRRDAFDRLGGFEPTFRDLYEDQVFLNKICLASPVLVTDVCWDRYRQHPNSICAVAEQTGSHDAARLTYLRWLEQYLKDQRIVDRRVWSALAEALEPYAQDSGVALAFRSVRRRCRKWLRRVARVGAG